MEPPGFPDWSINAFVEQLAQGNPLPGGGCVVALAGALAAALGSLAAQLSSKGHHLSKDDWRSNELLEKIREQQSAFLDFLDADALAYQEVVKARRLPRLTPEERQLQKVALETAFLKACNPPLQMASRGLELLQWAVTLADNGNPVTLADVGVMGFLAEAVVQGALINIFSNLGMIQNSALVQANRERARQIKQEVDALGQQFNILIYHQIGEVHFRA
jgi:formiminotetrahydrofolate cyclodeaminase